MRKNILTEKHFPMDLRFFGYDKGDGGAAGGDDQGGDDPNKDGDGDDGEDDDDDGGDDEKKHSDKDMEAAVQRRLAREKRKWMREQKKKGSEGQDKPKGGGSDDDDGEGESEAEKRARAAEEKSEALELKWTCLEHDVKKDCVDDVLALAKVHAAKDSSLDIEDAIDAVLKKYPQFKEGYDEGQDDPEDGQEKKGWGQRHGKPPKKASTVEEAIRMQMFGK